MIIVGAQHRIVETVDELPFKSGEIAELYMDFECNSFNYKEEAYRPYHGHRIAGIGILADDSPIAYYVPIRHVDTRWNLPIEPVRKWLIDILDRTSIWYNHGIKFDEHFLLQEGIEFLGEIRDTNTLSKLINSDLYNYGLKVLNKLWLNIDAYVEDIQDVLKQRKTKNYAEVPADIMGRYCCEDVIAVRCLNKYIEDNLPEECRRIYDIESKVTPVLFDIEKHGMLVNPTQLMTQEYIYRNQLAMLDEEIYKLSGQQIRPHTNEDCYDLLCNQYGLPVLGWTDKEEPSFDQETLIEYSQRSDVRANENLFKVVQAIQQYRTQHTVLNFFITPYQVHQVNNVMHSDYNQTVRTGRMSCRRPNSQQLNAVAKSFILPRPGYVFLRWDYSQVEFRLISHYIKDEKIIAAYAANPRTDFHAWVAEMCKIPRKPAKNVNFAIAYGGGKKRIVSMLSENEDLTKHLRLKVDELLSGGHITKDQSDMTFKLLCKRHGEYVYNYYHETIPGIRKLSNTASENCKLRGYVFNAFGRRRHLPAQASFRAFNSVIQSCAADVMKDRLIAIAPRYCQLTRDNDISLVALVHDEFLMEAPESILQDTPTLKKIANILESPSVEFRVPIKVDVGYSNRDWADASKNELHID